MGAWEPIRTRCPLVEEGLRYSDLEDGWCDRCNERVVNLSEMTERQARRLVKSGSAKCVAVEKRAGRPVFRTSRLASLLLLFGLSDARAADVDVRTGIDMPEVPETVGGMIDFGQSPRERGLLPLEFCHPHRFPHGPSGRAWISVGRGLKKVWKRVVLECRDGKDLLLREKRDFPRSRERLQFTALPENVSCEIELRGGATNETLSVRTKGEAD